jgi:UDP-glucose 4-epimerase
VLVTGASGFVGSRVVRRLSDEAQFDVVATDIASGEQSEALATLPGVRFEAADLRDEDAIERLTEGVTHVVHLAALRSKASQGGPRAGLDVNVGSTYCLLMQAAKRGMTGFVYGSSHLVYGAFPDKDQWFSEPDAAVRTGLSLYAAAKVASEAFLRAFADEFGFANLSLRFGGIYGPNSAPGSNSYTMLDVLDAIDRNDVPVVTWSRDTRQALIYVEDVARSVVRALDFPISGTAVNVVDTPRSCEEIYSTLVRLYGADPERLVWADRQRFQNVRGDLLVEGLGCPPATPLEAGLASIIEWHRSGAAR